MSDKSRCVLCNQTFTAEQLKELGVPNACPNCKSKAVPCDPDNDVMIKINWHEARIIFMWAERHASHLSDKDPASQNVFYAIAKRVKEQHPNQGPLTFQDELGIIRDTMNAEIEQNVINEPNPPGAPDGI